jgi:hypothetical protein
MTDEEFERFLHRSTKRRLARRRRLFPSLVAGQGLVGKRNAG